MFLSRFFAPYCGYRLVWGYLHFVRFALPPRPEGTPPEEGIGCSRNDAAKVQLFF